VFKRISTYIHHTIFFGPGQGETHRAERPVDGNGPCVDISISPGSTRIPRSHAIYIGIYLRQNKNKTGICAHTFGRIECCPPGLETPVSQAEARRETRRDKGRFKVRDLLADAMCRPGGSGLPL